MSNKEDKGSDFFSPDPKSYRARKMRLRQGWADYFMEKAEKYRETVPIDYNNWVASLLAAQYFGDSIAGLKLREELQRLSLKQDVYVPKTAKERLQVAHFHLTGIGRGKNEEKALTTYGKLVEEDKLPEAQYALGMCYLDGIVVKQNTQLALEFLEKSAQQGYALARYQYALCIFMCKGEGRDLQFCFDEFLHMANQGCAFACTLVGVFYQYGIAVPRDPRMAEGYINHGEKNGFSVDRFGEELYEVVEDLILDYMDDFPLSEE